MGFSYLLKMKRGLPRNSIVLSISYMILIFTSRAYCRDMMAPALDDDCPPERRQVEDNYEVVKV